MRPYSLQQFITRRDRPARRGAPAVLSGTALWAIRLPGGGYFHYSYTDRDYAEHIAQKLREDETFQPDFNRAKLVENTSHSTRSFAEA